MTAFDTARLHLRLLDGGDEALYCHIYTDPGLMRHVDAPLSDDSARASFAVARHQNAASPVADWWVLVERASGEGVGLLGTTRRGDAIELGVVLLSAWHGRGYAAEAISGLVERLFEHRRDTVLVMRHAVDNAAMFGLMRKLPFRRAPADAAEVVWRLDGG